MGRLTSRTTISSDGLFCEDELVLLPVRVERILLTVLTVLNVPLVLPPLALVMLVMLEAASMVSSVKLLSASQSMQVMSWFHVEL